MTTYHQLLPTEEDTIATAVRLSQHVLPGCVIFLCGPLGAGKTTFARGFLRGLGHESKVKSPTYTLVEPYVTNDKTIFHFDLYRLADARELEYLGINEYFTENSICLIEWPEKGYPVLPPADLVCTLSAKGAGRDIEIASQSGKGNTILARFSTEA